MSGTLQANMESVVPIVNPSQRRIDVIFWNEDPQTIRADRPFDGSAPCGFLRLYLDQFREKRQVCFAQRKLGCQFRRRKS